jgi:hypothetical protein
MYPRPTGKSLGNPLARTPAADELGKRSGSETAG